MVWFLIRVAVLVFVIWLAYAFVSGRYGAVKRHYSWMHPHPHMVE